MSGLGLTSEGARCKVKGLRSREREGGRVKEGVTKNSTSQGYNKGTAL